MPFPQSHFYTSRQIWVIAYPILLATLMEQLIGTTATAFLGRVGEIELGASALGGIFYIAIFMLGLGFSIGAQILIGRRNGEGNYKEIGTIFYHSLAFLLLFALFLFVFTRLWGAQILKKIISSHDVFLAANTYLQWRIYGFFFAFINSIFRAFYVGTTHTRTLTFNSIVMVVSNILFDYVLIFGKFGIPAFGIAGAAIGNVLAESASTAFFILHTRLKIPYAKYALNRLPRFHFSLLEKMLGLSVWTMVQNFLSLATWFLFFLAVEHLGERDLAATNIVRNISSFTYMTVTALGATASTLVSNLMGQSDCEAVLPMLKRTIRLGLYILIPTISLLFIFGNAVLSIFTNDVAVIEASRGALYTMLSSYLFTIPGQILFMAVSGTGNTRTALFFEFFSLTLYTLYIIIAIFYYRVPLWAGWLSEHIYNVIILLLSFSYIKWGNWRTKRI